MKIIIEEFILSNICFDLGLFVVQYIFELLFSLISFF